MFHWTARYRKSAILVQFQSNFFAPVPKTGQSGAVSAYAVYWNCFIDWEPVQKNSTTPVLGMKNGICARAPLHFVPRVSIVTSPSCLFVYVRFPCSSECTGCPDVKNGAEKELVWNCTRITLFRYRAVQWNTILSIWQLDLSKSAKNYPGADQWKKP